MSTEAWSRDEFEAQLRARGAGYHIHHPFNVRMNDGLLGPDQIRGWVANRFYYQVNIPQKDGAIIANCPDRATRRRWVRPAPSRKARSACSTRGRNAISTRLAGPCSPNSRRRWARRSA